MRNTTRGRRQLAPSGPALEPIYPDFWEHAKQKRQVRDQATNFTKDFLFTNPKLPQIMHAITPEIKQKILHAKIYYITFAQDCCQKAAARGCSTALELGVDECYIFDYSNLDDTFRRKNEHILKLGRGAGYWIWKPYIIYQTLAAVAEGDYVIFQDADAYLVKPVHLIIAFMEEHEVRHHGVLAFNMIHIQRDWCKRDAFKGQNCDTPRCHNARQIDGSFHIWRKGPHSLNVSSAWLREIQNIYHVSDVPNIYGLPNLPSFREHRHDQAILTNIFSRENWETEIDVHNIMYSSNGPVFRSHDWFKD
jgi:hypothetical protein